MTSRSRKSRRITARSAAKAISLWALAGLLAAPVFAASPEGRVGGSSLKWKPRSTVSAPRQEVTPSLPEPRAIEPEPRAIEPDDAARPIAQAARASTARIATVRRDDSVRQAQATSALADPFGDKQGPGSSAVLPTEEETLHRAKKVPMLPPPPSSPNATIDLAPPRSTPATSDNVDGPCPDPALLRQGIPVDLISRFGVKASNVPECILPDNVEMPTCLPWDCKTYTWKASGLCHKPLYFEEVALERYGHSTGPFSQPLVSGVHFFGCLALLPYQMGVHAPNECMYALGYYRPGSCAPWLVPGFPISIRGALYEAAVVGAIATILPW